MAGEMKWGVMKLALLVVGLLALVPDTTQLTVDHPLHNVVQRVNDVSGPFLGIVISSGRDEKILKNSTYFVPNELVPYLTIAGRRFNFGTFNGVSVIYVNVGSPLTAVGVTVQIMIDTFRITGLINYGDAGAVSNRVFIADVIVPASVAYTGVWSWKKYEPVLEADAGVPTLNFGDYNVPEAGENSLGSISFQTVKMYTPTSSKKETFWFPVHSDWLDIASEIKSTRSNGYHIVHGVQTASSDIYLLNTAYANFLYKNVNVTAVDTEAAAFVSTAHANGVKNIVFRGISDKVGLSYDKRLAELASKNVLEVVAKFIDRVSSVPLSHQAY